MVETNLFREVGGRLTERLFSGVLWFGIGFLIVIVLGFLMWWFFIYRRKFDIKVKVKSERSGDQYSILWDKAAILKDFKNKLPYFRVWGLQRDFLVPDFQVLQKTNEGDYLELYRKGEEEFYFCLPPKIDKTVIIKSGGAYVPLAKQTQKMLDPGMAFWAAKRKTTNKKMFDTEHILMKLLPYIPHIVGGIILIFVLWILMDNLPTILQELRHLVESMNNMRAAEITTSS